MAKIDVAVDAAYRAGFRGAALEKAVAIAGCESGYDPAQVTTQVPGFGPEHSVGLWQINTKAHKEYTDAQLKDPFFNGGVAYKFWQARGFRDWAICGGGGYLPYVPGAKAAILRYMGQGITPVDPFGGDYTVQGGSVTITGTEYPPIPADKLKAAQDAYNRTVADIAGPCNLCGIPNPLDAKDKHTIPACFACLAAYFTKGLTSIGINLGFVLLFFFGLYLLFRPEIHKAIADGSKHVSDAAKVAAVTI